MLGIIRTFGIYHCHHPCLVFPSVVTYAIPLSGQFFVAMIYTRLGLGRCSSPMMLSGWAVFQAWHCSFTGLFPSAPVPPPIPPPRATQDGDAKGSGRVRDLYSRS